MGILRRLWGFLDETVAEPVVAAIVDTADDIAARSCAGQLDGGILTDVQYPIIHPRHPMQWRAQCNGCFRTIPDGEPYGYASNAHMGVPVCTACAKKVRRCLAKHGGSVTT